jgi:hypothetical protein
LIISQNSTENSSVNWYEEELYDEDRFRMNIPHSYQTVLRDNMLTFQTELKPIKKSTAWRFTSVKAVQCANLCVIADIHHVIWRKRQ